MFTSEVYYHNKRWRAAIVECDRLGQVIERHSVGRFGNSKDARERADMVLEAIKKETSNAAS